MRLPASRAAGRLGTRTLFTVILRFSAVVARHRRRVLLTAMAVGTLAVVASVRAASEPTWSLAVIGAVAALATATGAVIGATFRWRAGPAFEVDESGPAFRTPRSAAPVFLVLFLLSGVALLGVAGGWPWAHGDRDGGWVVVMVLIGVPALLLAAAVWRGHGITLTPDGLHGDRGTGTVTIPWTALAATQPRPATPPTESHLDLVLAHPDDVTRSGLVPRRNRITFEGTEPAFAAAAIRHYAAHPADRHGIGTQAGHRRLVETLLATSGPAEPPPSRRRVTVLAVLGVLTFVVAVMADTWVDVTFGPHRALGYASDIGRYLLLLISLHLVADAVRGARARSRAPRAYGPPPPERHPPTAPATTMPSWARDVTDR
jgi:hypothetical protein